MATDCGSTVVERAAGEFFVGYLELVIFILQCWVMICVLNTAQSPTQLLRLSLTIFREV